LGGGKVAWGLLEEEGWAALGTCESLEQMPVLRCRQERGCWVGMHCTGRWKVKCAVNK
jgi:hypothetical protein